MSEKISEYATSVTALASGDLMDVSKLISTSPDVYQSQKLNYSLLLTELNADLTINNLGNSDLTSTTNARYFKLNGDATTNLLRVQNNSNQNIVQFRGDRSILIDGYTTNGFVKTSAGTGLITVSTQVSATEGGTGRSSWTANALPYISATNTFGEILAGTNGNVLTMVAGVPSWAAAPNLGSANLTSSDDARTFTLKTGTTATQNFQIKNSAGKSGFYYDGVGRVMFNTSTVPADIGGEPVNFVMGDSTTGVTANTYLITTGSSQYTAWRIYGGSSLLQYYDSRGGQYWRNQNNNANTDIEFRQYGNGARISITTGDINTWQSYLLMGAEGYNNVLFKAAGSSTAGRGGIMEIYNGVGNAVKTVLTGNRSQVEAVWFADGLVLGGSRGRSATPFFDVMGSGSTSATTTALFQNSASVAALTIKDDLTSTFGGIVTVPQIITTPATITVTANAGTVTRANRINKFTNSSAATMTITMSTTAALDGDMVQVRIYDFSAAAQTITWVNTENSSVTVPATSNGSTTLPLTVGFQYNSATSKWRCIGSV